MLRRFFRITASSLLLMGLLLPSAAASTDPANGISISSLLMGLLLPSAAASTDPANGHPANTASAQPDPASNPASPPPAVKQATPAAAAGSYSDLPKGHWAYPGVTKLREAGVLSLDPSGRFRPADPIQRAELYKMVLTARRIEATTGCLGQFLDVPCWAWYAPSAELAYRMAVADLQGADRLEPEGAVTREELFSVIIRILGRRWDAARLGWEEVSAQLAPFSDRNQVSASARPALALALKQSILTGYGDGTLRPQQVTTRAEAAVVISRILLGAEELQTATVDGHKIVHTQALDMTATMYTSGETGVGWVTYTGLIVRPGTVAVDPTVIPLGRLLYVEGYGYAVAADIGGAIRGNRIDLFTRDYHEAAVRFGIQPRKVYVLP